MQALLAIFIGAIKAPAFWIGIATVLLGTLYAPVTAYIAAHPGPVATLMGLVLMALRSFTTQPLIASGRAPAAKLMAKFKKPTV